ncbi:hypothetical protein Poli38472_003570 [Pythium oligandrum]|uniref:TIR domain-containing protein n=1 Tax=Pythium oligandrum TaxID=41045 RepID=A0A8K1FJ84_PYTOL|nr:hypothetical protein Poli38472_003570 [Pythium oligandrum]|eukprot:TMW65805.1 hypothetical protein Poli38472_003570 [Pythium oligandrum]
METTTTDYHEILPSPRMHRPPSPEPIPDDESSDTQQESPPSSRTDDAATAAALQIAKGFIKRRAKKGQASGYLEETDNSTKTLQPRGEPRKLPHCLLGRGYQSNSYFAHRLLNIMMFIALIDIVGILVYWLGKDIDDGGVYVPSVYEYLKFKESKCDAESCRSCNTVVAYAVMVYHMLPIMIMIGLPASGLRACEPFKRELRLGNELGKSKVKRSLYLQACELVAVVVLVGNAVVFLYFVYSFFNGDNFNCSLGRVQVYAVFAVISFIAAFVELTYFARFREHLKMQLGAFKESDQTGDVRSRLARRRSRYRTERSRVISDIRKRLFKETELGNLREIESILTYAQSRLGDDFADDMYTNASIFFKIFSRSKKNPLHMAAYHGNIAVMDMLLKAGLKVNSYDKVARMRFSSGDIFWYFAQHFISNPALAGEEAAVSIFKTTLVTPLHCAVSTGQINAVEWLIRNGADVNLRSQSSISSERVPPLFVAENPEIVSLLLEAGANHLEVPDPGRLNTLTVLQLAYLRDNIPVAHELEKWGGDVALTPLHTAAASNDVHHVKKLLKRGADPNCVGEHGYSGLNRRTPLHWGAINGALEAVELLLKAGADPNFQDVQGRTPLHWAARVNRANVVRALLENEATDPHIRDNLYMTPILCAAQASNVTKEIFEELVRHGANINDEMPNGDTPLHLAMKCENETSALALLLCGADIMRTNMDGFRPVDCTTSTKLQFEIKRAAGNRDVMISYTHSHAEFARKLRKSLEDASITTWLDQMDPSGIGGGSVWREEIARGIKNAAVVVCILTEDYASSEWCLKELALAKECGTPIMAISTERAAITEELQVYLYTRQMVPFEPSILSVNNENKRNITYTYDEARYSAQFRLLLDGVRDEIENRRKEMIRRGNRRRHNESNPTLIDPASIAELDIATVTEEFVFISHGDQHGAFTQRIYERLSESGVYCFLDGAQGLSDMQERIHLAKEAILKCSCFIVIISSRTTESELVRDQLAFAEDKGRPMLPIMLNDLELKPDKLYTLSRTNLLHFTPELGFNASFTTLLRGVQEHVTSNSMAAPPGARRARPTLFSIAQATAFGRLRNRGSRPNSTGLSSSLTNSLNNSLLNSNSNNNSTRSTTVPV